MKTEILRLSESAFKVKTPYSPIVVERFRTIPGGRFDPSDKGWAFPAVRDCFLMVCDVCGVLPGMLGEDFSDLVERIEALEVPPDLTLIDGHPWITPPFAHQKANLARLLGHRRWLLADEMGTGKTLPVANFLLALVQRWDGFPPGTHILILCPKSVKQSWRNELAKHADLLCDTGDYGCQLGESTIRVDNYEQLRTKEKDFSRVNWQIIVLDEIQRCKSFGSQTCRAVRRLTDKAANVYGLSGTPAPNGLEDWCGVLAALDPAGVPWQTKGAFEARHVYKSRVGGDGPWVVSGYRNVIDLQRVVRRYTSRVLKSDCLDLPEKLYIDRFCALQGEQQRIYRELRNDAVARLGEMKDKGTLTAQNILTESLRLLQITGGFVPDDNQVMHATKENAKISLLADILDDMDPDKQVVLWFAFREELRVVAALLGHEYGPVVTLTGDSTDAERAQAITDFVAGKARFFLGMTAAGSKSSQLLK